MISEEQEENTKQTQIFSLTWIKRNAAKKNPDQMKLTEDEISALLNPQKLFEKIEKTEYDENEDENNETLQQITETNNVKKEDNEDDDDLKEFNLDDYDDEENDEMKQISNLCMFSSNADDPYITKTNQNEDEDDSSEDEEIQLVETDNLLVCACCERDEASLEIYVYNDSTNDFYIHHDIPLPGAPLCLEWLDFNLNSTQSDPGNFVAVGNLNSEISIWDIDLLNTIEPAFTLGISKKKQKMKVLMGDNSFGHTDAVLGLSWTPLLRSKLASASVDRLVAVWDLEKEAMECKLSKHKDKVQTVQWQPQSTYCLLSGSFNGRIYAFDTRAPSSDHISWRVKGEIEKVAWNVDDNNFFAASTDVGSVSYFDVRRPGKALFRFKAHESAVPGLAMTSSSLLHTASSDGFVKKWKMTSDRAELVEEKDFNMGMVHCLQPNPDVPDVLAVGGEKNGIRLWKHSKEQNRVLSSNDVTGDVDEAGDGFVQNGKVAKERSQNFSKGKKKKVFKVVDDHRSFNKRQTASDVPEVKKQKSSHSKGANNKNMSSQKDTKRRKKVFKKSVKMPNYSNK